MISEIANNLLGVAEAAANRLLGLDEEALRQCAELQGHIVAIEISDVGRTLYIHPGSWGMRISLQAPPREPDAVIRGRLASLINLSRQQDKISTSIQERIEISGNTAVARRLQNLLGGIAIDWEEQLSRLVGDIAAYRIFQGLDRTRQMLSAGFESLTLSGRDYLQEETRQLPTSAEFELFREQVTTLRNDVERIEALINFRLNSRS
jgi:ubiquinone biosynthesis protein UbiJ